MVSLEYMLRGAMRLKLYVVHGSHPCAAVEKALSLKGLDYSVVEWPPPMQAPMQRLIFGGRTVPGLRIDGSEKVQGSRAIMRRLDELAPDPRLYPEDLEQRARVEEADQWGDEVFQDVARELVWAGMLNNPSALVSYARNSKLPLPAPAIKLSAPLVARMSARLNRTNDEVAHKDLLALPEQLDQIDTWITDGRIGDPEHPNAADLQILSTLALILTVADARPFIAGRPCEERARALFPSFDGEIPAGSLRAA
jgi:glutathione S-transferase